MIFINTIVFARFSHDIACQIYYMPIWSNAETFYIQELLQQKVPPRCSVDIFSALDPASKEALRERMITVAPCYSTLAWLICAKRIKITYSAITDTTVTTNQATTGGEYLPFSSDISRRIALDVYSTRDDRKLWLGGIPEEFRN